MVRVIRLTETKNWARRLDWSGCELNADCETEPSTESSTDKMTAQAALLSASADAEDN